jgi:hypothetical protein
VWQKWDVVVVVVVVMVVVVKVVVPHKAFAMPVGSGHDLGLQ